MRPCAQVIDREYAALSAHRHPNIIRMVYAFMDKDAAGEYTAVAVVQELAPGLPEDLAGMDAMPERVRLRMRMRQRMSSARGWEQRERACRSTRSVN